MLRQQLAVLRRATPRPRLRPIDRAFWVVVSRLWGRWADAPAIAKPSTVITWHRRGFARYWTWKSRRVGRPPSTCPGSPRAFVADAEDLHVNVTAYPHAAWAAQQIVEAIGADFVPRYLIRDRDGFMAMRSTRG